MFLRSAMHLPIAVAMLRAVTLTHSKCGSEPEGPKTPLKVLAPRRSHRPVRLLLLRRHGRHESEPPHSSHAVSNSPGRNINTEIRRMQPEPGNNVAYPTLRSTRHNLLLTPTGGHATERTQNAYDALTQAVLKPTASAHAGPQLV